MNSTDFISSLLLLYSLTKATFRNEAYGILHIVDSLVH